MSYCKLILKKRKASTPSEATPFSSISVIKKFLLHLILRSYSLCVLHRVITSRSGIEVSVPDVTNTERPSTVQVTGKLGCKMVSTISRNKIIIAYR